MWKRRCCADVEESTLRAPEACIERLINLNHHPRPFIHAFHPKFIAAFAEPPDGRFDEIVVLDIVDRGNGHDVALPPTNFVCTAFQGLRPLLLTGFPIQSDNMQSAGDDNRRSIASDGVDAVVGLSAPTQGPFLIPTHQASVPTSSKNLIVLSQEKRRNALVQRPNHPGRFVEVHDMRGASPTIRRSLRWLKREAFDRAQLASKNKMLPLKTSGYGFSTFHH